MKKSTLIGFSILSVFLLCSISYNPIIADNNIQSNESRTSIKDVLLKFKTIDNEDCGCKDSTVRRFPILCQILLPIALFYRYLIQVYYDYNAPQIIRLQYTMFKGMAESWGCWWIWWESTIK